MNLSKDYLIGLELMETGEWLKAINHLTLAINENSTEVEFYSKRGVCYLNAEQYDLSMFDFNKALDLDPNYSYRYSCRAFLKTRIKDFKGAIEDYEKALDLDPDDPIIYNNMGLVVEQMGNIKKAERYYKKSNELEGYNPEKRFGESNDEEKPNAPENTTTEASHADKASMTKTELAKKVFSDKGTFKEFMRFIGNGFKGKK